MWKSTKALLKYMNNKTRTWDQISAYKDNDIVISKEEEMCEIHNEKFERVFVEMAITIQT